MKDSEIKISIIIPVHNAASYLEQTLNSLVHQSLKEIEIICINDGSTDGSLDILKTFSKQDNRIKLINQINKGIGLSRNLGISLSRGEYIAFVDADDFVTESTYEKAYSKALENDYDVVMFGFHCLLDDGSDIHPDVKKYFDIASLFESEAIPDIFNYKDIKKNILRKSWNIWNKLYKAEFIKKNRLEFLNTYFQDSPFYLETLVIAEKIGFLNEKLYTYRLQNPNSVTNTHYKSEKVFEFFIVVDEMKKMLLRRNKFEELKIQYIEFKLVVLNAHFKSIVDDHLKKRYLKNIIYSVKQDGYSLEQLRNMKLALAPDHFLYSDEFSKEYFKFNIYNSLLIKLAKLNFRIFK